MSLQVLVVGRGHDLGLNRPLKISHFFGPLINEQHENMHFRVVGCAGIGDLLEDGGFAGARRRDDQSAGAFADGGHHVDDARFDQVGRGLELKFLDGVDRG